MDRRALLVVLASCAACGAASADIVNGGFESSFSDGNADPFPGWDSFDGRNVSISDGIGGLVYEGQYSARLNYTHGDDGVELNQRITGLTPGGFYEVFGMVNITEFDSKGWAVAGLQINVTDSDHDGLIFSAIRSSTTDGWQPFAVEFMAPSDGEVWVNTMWHGMNSGDAFVDGVGMRTTPTPGAAVLLAGGLLAGGRRRAR